MTMDVLKEITRRAKIINGQVMSYLEEGEDKKLMLAVRHYPAAGGKRLRPMMAQVVAQAVGGAGDKAIPFASALEVIHNFTLVHGIKQYIILGAGLDTFAFRRPDIVEQLDIYEIDHPATQQFKQQRIAEMGWEHPASLHFIPIDFTTEDLKTVLSSSDSFDQHVRSFFSWLGVTYYLTRDDVFTTLRSVADIAPAGSRIVFDYSSIDAFIPEKSSPRMKERLEFFRSIGEPMITGFNSLTLADDIASLGLNLQENLRLLDVKERYYQGHTDDRHAQEYEYIAYADISQGPLNRRVTLA